MLGASGERYKAKATLASWVLSKDIDRLRTQRNKALLLGLEAAMLVMIRKKEKAAKLEYQTNSIGMKLNISEINYLSSLLRQWKSTLL